MLVSTIAFNKEPLIKAWGMESQKAGTLPKLFEIDPPQAGPSQVLVEVKGSSLNPADLKVMTGKNGGGFLHSSRPPIFLGFDFAGVITQVGLGVSGMVAGQEVFGFLPYAMKTKQGAFCQKVAVDPTQVALKPSRISFAEAACLGTAASAALQALRDLGKLKSGQRLLINGASGGVGTFAIQMGKNWGAEVWGICGQANLDFIKDLGADKALDYEATTIGNIPEKFDLIFDVASNSTFAECSKVLLPKGIYISLLPTPAFIAGFLKSLFSSKACKFLPVAPKKDDLELIAQWVDGGKLKVCVEKVMGFNEVSQGLDQLNRKSPRGKIALSFNF